MQKLLGFLIILCFLSVTYAQDDVELGTFEERESMNKDPRAGIDLSPLERFENSANRMISTDPDIFSGSYLVYDCLNKKYVCVDDFTNNKCIDSRQKSLNENSLLLNCAPLKKFDTFYNCTRANLFAIGDARPVRFCFRESN